MTGRGREVLNLLMDDFMKDAYPEPDTVKKDNDFTLKDIYEGETHGRQGGSEL